ncbi:hypothetical protein [Hymenobacter guriensis]|uniref:Uncharacterized protein n=1 Tax=Hymenobacter guriensis TaxID=2793065 RepID=A0ABS0KWY7_9BACT|nr:hypothetical protein [Hymenobacter guriensis]MBG8552321.1 hypothetical protein [Hymenobacter guriensis]
MDTQEPKALTVLERARLTVLEHEQWELNALETNLQLVDLDGLREAVVSYESMKEINEAYDRLKHVISSRKWEVKGMIDHINGVLPF